MRMITLAGASLALALAPIVARAQGPPVTPLPGALGPTAQAAGAPTTPLYAAPISTYQATAVATIPPTRLGTFVGRIGSYMTQFGQPRLAALPSTTMVSLPMTAPPLQVQAQAAAPLYLIVPASGSMPQPAMAWGGQFPTMQR